MQPRWEQMTTAELFAELRETVDPTLRDYLIERHEGLVRHVARQYSNSGESYEDLVSVGHLGLVNAVDRFDPGRGTKFATFAVPTIKGEIRRHFRDRTWGLRVPRRIQELSLKARQMTEEITQRVGRSPTYGELADALAVSEEDVIEALEVGRQYDLLSIDSSTEDDDGGAGQSVADRHGVLDQEVELFGQRNELAWALKQLPPRQRVIMVMRFYLDLSQQDVGERLGISQMHVSRLQQKALARLKQLLSKE
ncbi:MAG: SigB/SigF/SigG family RNA polymerase sigma factor [Armatimonadota bacterium]